MVLTEKTILIKIIPLSSVFIIFSMPIDPLRRNSWTRPITDFWVFNYSNKGHRVRGKRRAK